MAYDFRNPNNDRLYDLLLEAAVSLNAVMRPNESGGHAVEWDKAFDLVASLEARCEMWLDYERSRSNDN